MWKTNRLASTYIQQNAHTLLHAKLSSHNKYNMDLFMSELAHTYAIICLLTTVCKTYILALGHELTHSHTTDEEVYKSMWKSIFIHGLDMHLCKILKTKTLNRGRMLLSEWRLTLEMLRLSIWLFFGAFLFCTVPPSRLPSIPCILASPLPALDYTALILLLTVLHTIPRLKKSSLKTKLTTSVWSTKSTPIHAKLNY